MATPPETESPLPGSPAGGPESRDRAGRRASGGRYVDALATPEERTYGLFMHLVGLLSLASLPVPVAGLIGSIIMWKIKSDTSPFLDDHGRDAVNFQISLLLYGVVITVLIVPTLGLSSFGFIATLTLALIGCIRGAIASNRGEYYRYPMTFRFLKEA